MSLAATSLTSLIACESASDSGEAGSVGSEAGSADASAEEDDGSGEGFSLWVDSTAELVGAGGTVAALKRRMDGAEIGGLRPSDEQDQRKV